MEHHTRHDQIEAEWYQVRHYFQTQNYLCDSCVDYNLESVGLRDLSLSSSKCTFFLFGELEDYSAGHPDHLQSPKSWEELKAHNKSQKKCTEKNEMES